MAARNGSYSDELEIPREAISFSVWLDPSLPHSASKIAVLATHATQLCL